MPNLRGKQWTPTTPANVEDAQFWEDHLISDEALTDLENKKHWHDNKEVLDELTEDEDGDLNYKGDKLGGSGSEVSWQQNTTTGTKIAEITIDGETQEVYAPTSGGGGGTTDYSALTSKPKINGVELAGNKTSEQLGLVSSDNVYSKTEVDEKVDKRVSISANQGLTDTEKTNARNNIGAGTYSKQSTGIPESDLADAVKNKIKNLDSNGEIDFSHVKNAAPGYEMLSTIPSVKQNTEPNKVVDALVVKAYSNRYTNSVISTLLANQNEITITNNVFKNDTATFEFMFEPTANANGEFEPIILAKYELDTTAGTIKITVATAPTVNTRIRVDVTDYRA